MTAKEHLEQYKHKTLQIEALQSKIREIRALAEKCTSVLSLTPGGNAHNDSRLEELVVKINTMEEQLGILWEERGGIFIDTVNLISEIPDERCRQILEKHYLELKPFSSIEDELYISSAHIYRLHTKGLAYVERLLAEK